MILHLLGPDATPAAAAECRDAIGADAVPRPAVLPTTAEDRENDGVAAVHRVVALGPAAERSARLAGLAVDASLSPAGGVGDGGRIPLTARTALRRATTRGGPLAAPARFVVCWDPAALAVAAAYLPLTARVLRLADPPDRDRVDWLRSRMLSAGFDIAAASDTLRVTLVAAGLPGGRVRTHAPTLDPRRLSADRAGFGQETATVRGKALRFAVVGGPGVDARPLVLAAALAQEAGGRRVELRLAPTTDRLAEALDVADAAETSGGVGPRVVQDPAMETPWCAFAGCDAALLPVGAPAHAARWAALVGVPRVFMQPPAEIGLDASEAGRDTDFVSRHPLPRDLAAAMVAAGAGASAAPIGK